VFLGSSRGLVSCCNTFSCQIHTVEVTGSNPVAPTMRFLAFKENPENGPSKNSSNIPLA
jgi:hypothetical protein